MGLDIERVNGKSWSYPYGMLHWIRYTAAIASGFVGSYTEYYEIEGEGKAHTRFPDYWQLMHFSDAEGIFVSESFLKDVSITEAYMLGSFDAMKACINRLWCWSVEHPEVWEKMKDTTGFVKKALDELQALFQDEDALEIVYFN